MGPKGAAGKSINLKGKRKNIILYRLPELPKAATLKDSSNKLAAGIVSGLTEGCFGLYIYKNTNYKTNWFVSLVFQISLHERDRELLEQFKFYFGVGSISSHE